MKNLSILVALYFLSFTHILAQSGFDKVYGDFNDVTVGFGVCANTDQGYTFCGYAGSNMSGFAGLFAARVTAQGDTLWSKMYGGVYLDEAFAVCQTTDGGFILTGYSMDNPQGRDLLLLRLDGGGNILWSRTVGTPLDEIGYAVIQTADGGFAALGQTRTSLTDGKAFLVKTDASGSVLWSRSYGSGLNEKGVGLVQMPDSGFAFSGIEQDSFLFTDLFLARTNSSGQLLWARRYGQSGTYEMGAGLLSTPDGGFALAGSTRQTANGAADVLFLKTDSAGLVQHAYSYDAGGSESANSLVRHSDGSYGLGGSASIPGVDLRSALMIGLDANLSPVWGRLLGYRTFSGIGGAGEAGAALASNGSGYAMTGYADVFFAEQFVGLFIGTDLQGNGTCGDSSLSFTGSVISVTTATTVYTDSLYGAPSVMTLTAGSASLPYSGCSILSTSASTFPDGFELYPNPVSDQLFIRFPAIPNQTFRLALTDLLGRVLINQTAGTDLDLSALPAGVYLLTVEYAGKTMTRKIVKE